jgi:PDZ domain-containing protein
LPRFWPPIVAVIALLVGGAAVGAWDLSLPYYAFSSGPVGDALAAVEVEEAPVYQSAGEMMMLTVTSQKVNLFEALVAFADPDVDLIPVEAVRPPDISDEEFTLRNRAAMDTSAETAITVALERLGFEVTPGSDGVQVVEVLPDVPAAAALEAGDVITGLEGREVVVVEDLAPIVTSHAIGDQVDLTLLRDQSELTVTVELVPRQDDPTLPMIGITAETLNLRFVFPFPIGIHAGQIGGPSAGMMYTLAVIDVLDPEDLTRGRVVAGTGTIDLSGNVGGIGGIRQKVVAAEAAGAEVMLIPAVNYEEAQTARRSHLELIPVNNLDEALAALERL